MGFLTGLMFGAYVGINGLGQMADRFQGTACDQYLNTVNSAQAPLSTALWDSDFGSNKECLILFLELNAHRPHAVLIYLGNGNGRRDGTLNRRKDFWGGYRCHAFNTLISNRNQHVLQSYADRLDTIRNFMNQYGNHNTQVVLVPELEDCLDRKAWKVLGPFLRDRNPYLLVRNPSTGSRELGAAYFLELHGDSRVCGGSFQVANLDGDTLGKASARNWLKKTRDCFIQVGYDPECQGRRTNGGFTPGSRSERDFECDSFWDELIGEL